MSSLRVGIAVPVNAPDAESHGWGRDGCPEEKERMTSTNTLVGITGVTGGLGGSVARTLAARGQRQRLIVRDAGRAPTLPGADVAIAAGYHDRAAMTEALRGVETLLLVSGRESPTRVAEHVSAIDAAVDAGVRRIVYTSFLGAAPDATFTLGRDHYATEQHIRQKGLAFTFLRNNLYLDLLPAMATPEGVIAGPAGNGKLTAVARDDCAAVAVAVLIDARQAGQTYAVTGRDAYTLADVAAWLSEVSDRTVTYKAETIAEAYASRAVYGAPRFEVEGWVSSYLAIAQGELDVITDTVQRLTDQAPQTLPAYLAAHPESYVHLRHRAAE